MFRQISAFLLVLSVALNVAAQQNVQSRQGRRTSVNSDLLPFGGMNLNEIPPEHAVKPGQLASPSPPELVQAAKGLSANSLSLERLQLIFSKELYVRRLTDCILHIGFCTLESSLDLHRRIKTAREGGALCEGCTRQQKLEQLQALIKAISLYRNHYADQWKRVEDRLLFVEDRL